MMKKAHIFGLSAEHLKFVPRCMYSILSSFMNSYWSRHTRNAPLSSAQAGCFVPRLYWSRRTQGDGPVAKYSELFNKIPNSGTVV